ncbi:MAG: hypothetical protein KAG34_06760 [Cocleimonas sp.]|nr:hypothetical protein [Cocleimonas sp.]
MLYKTLIAAIFILMTWSSIKQSKMDAFNNKNHQNFLVMQQQLLASHKKISQQQKDFKKQLTLVMNEQKLLGEKISQPPVKKINKKPIKKQIKKKTGADIIASLNKHLKTTEKYRKKKELKNASKSLLKFKEELWKARKNKEINKKTVLSMLSPIDITLKKWKAKKATFTTKIINNKMKYLSVKKVSK